MNAPIYKLNKAIIERFKIQALPSVVEGQGDFILVREIDARVLN
jgi:conjugal transfer pilus assembly protein TraW